MESHKEMISVCTRRLALYVLSLCMSVNIQAASISSIHTNSSGEQSDSLSFRTPFYSSETTHNPTDEDLIIPVDPAKPPVPIDSIWPIDPILPYPQDPEQPRNPYDGYSVGTPKGSLSVNKLGATVFNLQIKVPDGGPLTPVIGLSYNSQSAGYGLAGYGFNITGISAITRAGHDLFHDGSRQGVTYGSSDNLLLDGKLLILQPGGQGQKEPVYTVEGDPFTKVVMHAGGNDKDALIWFEVTTNTGITYQYGKDANSRIAYKNRNGDSRIAAWYVNRMTDRYSNYITYEYSVSNMSIRPTAITYGTNSVKSRGIINKVSFSYQSLGANARTFTIEDQQGKTDMCLSSILTTSNNSVYRNYTFTYDNHSDQSASKWTRLVKVEEKNGKGDKLPPIQFTWQYLPSLAVHSSQLEVLTKDNNSLVDETSKLFLSADLNGDGIGDIIRVSNSKITTAFWPGGTEWQEQTHVYVSRSKVSDAGDVTFESPLLYVLPSSVSMDIIKSMFGGASVMDFDGDGYNDLVLPLQNMVKGHWNQAVFYVIKGSDVAAGRIERPDEIAVNLKATDKAPLFAPLDVDGDGKDDIVCVEQRKKDDYYPCTIVQRTGSGKLIRTEVKLHLPEGVSKDIEKVFVGDYNNDGLPDLILLYDGGYMIYYNSGGNVPSSIFIETNTKSGSIFGNYWRMQQGDFDGDGLTDFVYNKSGETCLWIAHNNGNGTFSLVKSADIGLGDHDSKKDDGRFAIVAYDIDHDGRTDVMVCKAGYRHHGFPKFSNEYTDTQVRWLYSTGTSLNTGYSYTKNREDDATENYIFLGDFDGDGYPELANYGSVLNDTDDTFAERINIYKSGYNQPQAGKITGISDGMGNKSNIQYASATSPAVYKKSIKGTYPVNTYTLPLPVVAKVTRDFGAAGSQTTKYFYEDLRLHIAGRGMLGFNTITSENVTLGTKEETSITKWDETLWIPLEVRTLNSVGNSTGSAVSTYSVSVSDKNYFAYVSRREVTDLDGNTATTISDYDVTKGVIVEQTTKNDGEEMYKKVSYSDYQNKAGVWVPEKLTMSQKHADDPVIHTVVTTYSYDDKGNVKTSTENSGTNMELKTTLTYDEYGNVRSSVTSGSGVKAIMKYYDYDSSGRFVKKSYTHPASAVNTFTYDLWGNVLTEEDATEPSNILKTQYTYDGWGRKLTALRPDGTQTLYQTGWGNSKYKKYYTKESTTGRPSITVWYDKGGREVLQETFGTKGMPVSKTTTYNDKGLVCRIKNKTGKLTTTQNITYDDRGRVIMDVLSSGQSVAYSYGNRSVTTTTAGRVYTRTTDAWGNVIRSTDPVSEVEYHYSSIGKPSRVSTQGSIVTMTYDVAGNQKSLSDPDAGTSNYTYAADGTLLSQTDGRGVKTINSYDNLGRLASTQIGKKTIVYTYGTTGNEKLRLVKLAVDNNTVEYAYDKYGRIVTEKRNVDGRGTYSFAYFYNDNNQLSKTQYPGGLDVLYQYDDYGFKTQASIGDRVIYKVEDADGLSSSASFMGKLTATQIRDARGFASNVRITRGDETLETFNTDYDGATGNLLSRRRNNGALEEFGYDNLDRLLSVKSGTDESMRVRYAPNGNILFKTGVGNFYYDKNTRPHAVAEVENADGSIPGDALNTSFNDFGKIQLIEDVGKGLRMDFGYGPDRQRWYSELLSNGKVSRTTVYAGEYEKTTENGITREFYYLDGNTIVVRQNGITGYYLAFTDNLGSILSVMDENGRKVFDASYDAWGRQTVTLNTIGLHRGYTGHEMLSEFDIINMNGRLYDPVLGRFFSPDNYVQMPDNSQNFNRYSYCMNNPLKYVDPSGHFAWFIPVIAGAIVGAYAGASIQSGTAAFWKWKSDAWKGAIAGGIVGATVGYGVASALASSGAVSGLTTIGVDGEIVAKSAGITSSVMNSGSINIAFNAITGGGWDGAWKSGLVGLATGAWSITGGFGMMKEVEGQSKFWQLANRLGYQMAGTVGQSVGNNWAAGKGLFSKVTLGVGPLNLTLGKGQRLLQWENNLGNIAINAFGLVNTIAGGKVRFNTDNLTFEYRGGLMDIFQPYPAYSAGFSPHTVTGNSGLSRVLRHELHHLWHSRALNDMYLLNYGLQGLNALILKGNFVAGKNYYEDFVDNFGWWNTKPQG